VPRATGYDPLFTSAEQDALLDAIVERAAPGTVCMFDLDGCLFDNRHRQIHIYREFAGIHGHPELYRIEPDHFRDWDQRATLRRAGVPEAVVEQVAGPLRAWFMEHFFTSRAVQLDHAMPGAVRLVRACWAAGAHVVYLTGRHEPMRAGTAAALHQYGFPLDEGGSTLLMKPAFATPDHEYKDVALHRLAALGRPTVFLDNEPVNVNLFAERHPDALVVFVATDHSPRADEPAEGIPWMKGFLRTSDLAS